MDNLGFVIDSDDSVEESLGLPVFDSLCLNPYRWQLLFICRNISIPHTHWTLTKFQWQVMVHNLDSVTSYRLPVQISMTSYRKTHLVLFFRTFFIRCFVFKKEVNRLLSYCGFHLASSWPGKEVVAGGPLELGSGPVFYLYLPVIKKS